jgi:hypothetical protein
MFEDVFTMKHGYPKSRGRFLKKFNPHQAMIPSELELIKKLYVLTRIKKEHRRIMSRSTSRKRKRDREEAPASGT